MKFITRIMMPSVPLLELSRKEVALSRAGSDPSLKREADSFVKAATSTGRKAKKNAVDTIGVS